MSALSDWLANPVIQVHISRSDEVKDLVARNDFLEQEVLRLQSLYGQECNFNMRLQELLQEHKINWR